MKDSLCLVLAISGGVVPHSPFVRTHDRNPIAVKDKVLSVFLFCNYVAINKSTLQLIFGNIRSGGIVGFRK